MNSQFQIPSQYGPPQRQGPSVARVIWLLILGGAFLAVAVVGGVVTLERKARKRDAAMQEMLAESKANANEAAAILKEGELLDSKQSDDFLSRQIASLNKAAATATGTDAVVLRCMIERTEVVRSAVREHARHSDRLMQEGLFVPGALDTPEKIEGKAQLLIDKQIALTEVLAAYRFAADELVHCMNRQGVPPNVVNAISKDFTPGMQVAYEFQALEYSLGTLLLEMLNVLRSASPNFTVGADGYVTFTGPNQVLETERFNQIHLRHAELAAQQQQVAQHMADMVSRQ